MQQQRLMRSRTEVVISGVCGGLGTYFGIDPVIVRLIFALVTLTTGIGLIVYPALWIAMPKAPALPPSPFRDPMIGANEQSYVVQREREKVAAARYGEAPPPPATYKFDPITGAPIRRGGATGETTQLPYDPATPEYNQTSMAPPSSAPRSRHGARWAALSLIAVGCFVLADQIGLNTELVFPVIMILIGVFLLRRR